MISYATFIVIYCNSKASFFKLPQRLATTSDNHTRLTEDKRKTADGRPKILQIVDIRMVFQTEMWQGLLENLFYTSKVVPRLQLR